MLGKALDWQHVAIAAIAAAAVCFLAASGYVTDGETVTALLGVCGIGVTGNIAARQAQGLAQSTPVLNPGSDGGDPSVAPASAS